MAATLAGSAIALIFTLRRMAYHYRGFGSHYFAIVASLATTALFVFILFWGWGFSPLSLDVALCTDKYPQSIEPGCVEMRERVAKEDTVYYISMGIGLVWISSAIIYMHRTLAIID